MRSEVESSVRFATHAFQQHVFTIFAISAGLQSNSNIGSTDNQAL